MGLVRALAADGHHVTVIAPPGADVRKLMAQGMIVREWSLAPHGTSLLSEILSVFRLWTLLRAERPDGLLTFTIKPNVYGGLVAWLLGVPQLANVTGLGAAFQRGGLWAALARGLYRLVLGRARRVFFQNHDDLEAFVNRGVVDGGRAVVLPGSGVDLDRFNVIPLPEGTDDDLLKVLMVSRLLREKGIVEYAAAAAILLKRKVKVKCQLLGAFDRENPSSVDANLLEEWVASGSVEYFGEADDVRPFIALAHAVVLPSYREGTPRALLEAMAIGRAIVTTDVPGCRDMVLPGANGYLCQVRNPVDLADAIERLAGLSREDLEAMGRESRIKAETEYDEKLVISAYRQALAVLE